MERGRYSARVIYVILAAVLVIALLIAVFFGTYTWRQGEITRLQDQITQLREQIGTTQDEPEPTENGNNTYTSAKGVTVRVYVPEKNAGVTSPLIVLGEVPGNWSFEASFPIRIEDANGTTIKQAAASIIGDWMTDELVPFSATIEYVSGTIDDGVLILQKDNPSGLAENDDTVRIPVTFR